MGLCCGKAEKEYEGVVASAADRKRSGESPNPRAIAIFAGGCFWCLEAAFRALKGVSNVTSGFMGNTAGDPKYKNDPNHGVTSNAEAVQVMFDENIIQYVELVEMFWRMHNPTQLNRQGNDVGTEYRSAIFYQDQEQHRLAVLSREVATQAKIYDKPIITDIVPATTFYPASDTHQDYFNKNPENQYCKTVIGPKLKTFKKLFKEKLAAAGDAKSSTTTASTVYD